MSGRKVVFDPRNPTVLVANGDAEDPNEDDPEFTEDVGGEIRAREKRNTVKLDFDSDSSDDGETRRDFERQQKSKAEDDEDDMFGDADESKGEMQDPFQESRKAIELLDMKRFEDENIQDEPNEEREGDSDDSEESTSQKVNYYTHPEEHISGEIKKVGGPKLEAFSLKSDMEEGSFDADGNFVRRAREENAHQDEWLDNISKKDILKAKEAHERRVDEIKKEQSSTKPKSEYIAQICQLLEVSETPLEALQRLNISRNPSGLKRKAGKLGKSQTSEDLKVTQEIEIVSSCADSLLKTGLSDIYEMTREELLREYMKETGEELPNLGRKRKRADSVEEPQWELRWEGDEQIHGPYSLQEIKAWSEQNYLDNRAYLREIKDASDFVNYETVVQNDLRLNN